MASILLHDTVKDLHNLLQIAEDTSIDQFEVLLRRNVHNVFTLLDLSLNHAHRLDISTSVYEELLLVYCIRDGYPAYVDLNNDNIYQYLKEDTASTWSGSSLFDQLLQLLAESHHQNNRPARLKQSFSLLVSKFSELVQFCLKLHRDAESDLVDLVLRCFAYEHSYYSHLKSQLDGEKSAENDTEHMVLALDSFIRRNLPDETSASDSLFSYGQDDNGSSFADSSLDFECLDPSFTKLYQIFLQLALYKSLESFYQDALSYVKVMIKLFKVSQGIDYLERDSQEIYDLKLEHICDFFLNSESAQFDSSTLVLIPARFQALAKSIIQEMFESSRFHAVSEKKLALSLSSFELDDVRRLLRDELVELISNLETVVSILNEYGLKFELSFPGVFQIYVHLVYEIFPDSARAEDLRYIYDISGTISKIVNFENQDQETEGNLIRQIVFQLHEMQSKLLSTVIDLTLLMRGARKYKDNKLALKRQILHRWNRKMLSVAELDAIYDDELNTKIERKLLKKSLSTWYNKTLRFQKVQLQAATYSDKKTLAHFLSSSWLKKIIIIADSTIEADIFSIKPFFNLWRKKQVSNEENLHVFLALSDTKMKKNALEVWVLRHNHIDMLKGTSQSFLGNFNEKRDVELLAHAFSIFKNKFKSQTKLSSYFVHDDQSLAQKLCKLGQLEMQYGVRKCFDIWMHRFEVENKCKEFGPIIQRNQKRKGFQWWKKQLDMKSLGRILKKKGDEALLLTILLQWKTVRNNRIRGDLFYAKSLSKKIMLQWILKLGEIEGKERLDKLKVAVNFKKWRLQLSLQKLTGEINGKLASKVVRVWTEKTILVSKDQENAIEIQKRNLLRRIFDLWGAKHHLMLELAIIADLNFQRKHLNKFVHHALIIAEQNNRADKFAENRVPISQRILLQAVMRNWNINYLKMFDNHTLKAIDAFYEHVTRPGVLSTFLSHWKARTTHIERRKRQLEINYEHYLESCASKRAFFGYWVKLTREKWEDNEKSSQFHANLLHKKYLLTWYEKHVTKVDYLNDVAQNLIDQKDYLKLVDHLRKWNLRYIKNVKRNQQTCEIFAQKWEKAHLRSMFELWLHKTMKRSSLGDDAAYDYMDANTTIGSNYSPLAKKNPRLPTGSSILDGQSYLSTPVKKQVAVSPATPYSKSKGPSPTRLQETNQRMKFDRMDALISRYRLAKEGASKSSILRASASTRLPPPLHSKVPIPERPPAPKFEVGLSRSASPQATSSPSVTPGPTDHTTPSSISDNSILATAKKLRRIKPIVVPPADDLQDLQYSSASKLKERLILRKNSPGKTEAFGIL